MAHDYQTCQGDRSWYWATIHKIEWFFYHVIIYSLLANKKRYISNSTSAMDTKLDRVLVYDMGQALKSLLVNSSLHSWFISTSELYF